MVERALIKMCKMGVVTVVYWMYTYKHASLFFLLLIKMKVTQDLSTVELFINAAAN